MHLLRVSNYIEVLGPPLQGRVIHVSVGRDSVGVVSVSGVLFSADGGINIPVSRNGVKCSPGRTTWMLIRFAYSPEGERLEIFDAESIQMLVFTWSKHMCQSVTSGEQSFIFFKKKVVFFRIRWTRPG